MNASRYLLDLVLSLILKQIIKFREGVKWQEVRLYVERKVRDIVPGVWLDEQAVALALFVVDGAAQALQDTADLKKLLDAVARKDWDTALDTFKELLRDNWKLLASEKNPAQAKVLALLGVHQKVMTSASKKVKPSSSDESKA